jgi:CheY-like chemotaxis protein
MADKARILFVDDDYESLSDLKSLLEDYGYMVEINASMQIIDRLKSERFGLICIDMMIHPLSLNSFGEETQNIKFENTNFMRTGLEFYRRLRAGIFNDSLHSGTPSDVPVIFISAIDEGALRESNINDQRTLYLEKPFRFEKFLALISNLTT